MPYIKQEKRKPIDAQINFLEHLIPTSGELNYTITKLCLAYIEQRGLCYGTINDIVGVLECAKMEFNRRLIANYEDTKIKENGDVIGYEKESKN